MQYDKIPADLAQIPNWTLTTTPNGKAPRWGKFTPNLEKGEIDYNRPETNKTLAAIIPFLKEHPNHNAGIFTSMNNELIVIDLDTPAVCEKYLDDLRSLQQNSEFSSPLLTLLPPTYTEFSLSKKLHLYYFYSLKRMFHPAYANHPAGSPLEVGQTSIYNNFMVVTGDHVSISPLTLTELKDVQFHNITNLPTSTDPRAPAYLQYKSSSQPITTDNPDAITDNLITTPEELQELEQALKAIPLTQSQKVQKAWEAVTGCQYEHYKFWLSIGMALHSSATGRLRMRLADLFDEWSATDPLSYTGTDDVLAKWASFASIPRERFLTKSTIFALASELRMVYPVMKMGKGGKRIADPEAYENYAYFLKYYNITLYTDYQSYYISGNDDILIKYFNKPFILSPLHGPFEEGEFEFQLVCLIQTQMFPGQHINSTIATRIAKAFRRAFTITPNLFTMWLDSDTTLTQDYSPHTRPLLPIPPRKPPRSLTPDLDTLLSFIEFAPEQDMEVARAIFYASFMLIIKLNCFPEIGMDSAEGFLYLTGPQSSFKSTFCESLVPLPLKRYFVRSLTSAIRSDKGLRDFQLALAAAPFLVIDETEGFINFQESSSQFKSIMSKGWLDVTPIYATSSIRLQRRAFVMGSSNDYEQRMMRNGTRKMWWVRVNHIHTEDVIYFDWHTFYNSMRKEFEQCLSRGEQPWILPKDIMRRLDESNIQGTAQTEVDMILRECFPIDETVDAHGVLDSITNIHTSKLLCSAKQLLTLISMRWPDFNVGLPSLKNAVRRYASEFLQTGPSESFPLKGATGIYKDGVINTGEKRTLRTYYIVPWTAEEVARKAYKEWWE